MLAGLVGLSLGVLGAGGSILTAPIFVYVLGYGARQSIAMSLPVVGVVSLVGSVRHAMNGRVRPWTALRFGLLTMAGAYAGARAAGHITGDLQLALLAGVMFLAGVSMLRGREPEAIEAARAGTARATRLRMVLVGLAVGLLTGIVGIGGGFLIVPALVTLVGVPIREAVGTSLVVITMNAIGGSAGYLGTTVIPWGYLAAFTFVASLGIVLGSHLSGSWRPATLRRVFALFLLAVGAFILFENRSALGL